jgi:hypothetical protein
MRAFILDSQIAAILSEVRDELLKLGLRRLADQLDQLVVLLEEQEPA